MDEKRLAEIDARLLAATPGPWGVMKSTGPDEVWEIGPIHSTRDGALYAHDADMNFVAHAAEDMQWLITQLGEHRKIVEAIRMWRVALEHLSDGYYSVADATLEMKEAEATIESALEEIEHNEGEEG